MKQSQPVGPEIGLLLRQAHRRAAELATAALAPLGVTGRHFGVLLMLHRDGPLSQRELMDRLGAEKSSMVRTIDELEDRDLCVRRPSASDRRANAIHLTEAGRQLFANARGAATTVSETLLADLAPEERAQLCDLLARVIATPSR